MTQATQPVSPAPVQSSPADAEDQDEGLPQLEDIGRDYERLSKRIATIIKNARNGADVSIVDTLNLQGEVVLLLMDHLTHTKRMEDHAVWASEQLDNIADAVSGDSETSSQLHKSDADRYTSFLNEALGFIDDRIQVLTPEGGEPPTGLVGLRQRAVDLLQLTEEITLQEESEDEDDGDGDGDGEATSETKPAQPENSTEGEAATE